MANGEFRLDRMSKANGSRNLVTISSPFFFNSHAAVLLKVGENRKECAFSDADGLRHLSYGQVRVLMQKNDGMAVVRKKSPLFLFWWIFLGSHRNRVTEEKGLINSLYSRNSSEV